MRIGKIAAGFLILWVMCGPELDAAPAQSMEAGSIDDQIIVLYEEPQSRQLRFLEPDHPEIREREMLSDTVEVLTPAEGADVDGVIRELEQRPDVAAVGRNKKIPLDSLPNDPYVLDGTAWQFEAIGADQVWDAPTGENTVKVAVIDTGLNMGHEDLAGRCEIGYDYVADTDASMTDLIGHGTKVSGVISAVADNGKGIAGTAGSAPVSVVAYRAGGEDASDQAVRLDYVIAALEEITSRPDIQVVNLSFGGNEPDALEEAAVERAVEAGKVVVASAGNSGTQELNYPASYDGVISVGAVNASQNIAYFSNHNAQVDICAPGAQVYTTGMDGGGYTTGSGTSYASPIVAGAAAVVKQRNESLDAGQIEAILEETAEDKGDPGRDEYYGAGLLKLDQAVARAEEQLPFTDVSSDSWYYDFVKYVYENGLMTGLNDTTFGPGQTLARAQFAVILYRMNGEPPVEYTPKFNDVAEGLWYTDAILWASEQGVVTGYSNGNFGPGDLINREQMALMMYRYALAKGYDTGTRADISSYSDASWVSEFAVEAMQWAVGNGIITGKYNETMLEPQGSASRAECATIIMRFVETYEK